MFNRNVLQYLEDCWTNLSKQYLNIFDTRFNDIYHNGSKKADQSFFPSDYFPAGDVTIHVWHVSCKYAINGLWSIVKYPNGGHPNQYDAPSQHQIDAILQIPLIKRNPEAVEFVKNYAAKFLTSAPVSDDAKQYHNSYGSRL